MCWRQAAARQTTMCLRNEFPGMWAGTFGSMKTPWCPPMDLGAGRVLSQTGSSASALARSSTLALG